MNQIENININLKRYKVIWPYLLAIFTHSGYISFTTWILVTLIINVNSSNVNIVTILTMIAVTLLAIYSLIVIYKLVTTNIIHMIKFNYEKNEIEIKYFKIHQLFNKMENFTILPFYSYKMRIKIASLIGVSNEIFINYEEINYGIDSYRTGWDNCILLKSEFTKYSINEGKYTWRSFVWQKSIL